MADEKPGFGGGAPISTNAGQFHEPNPGLHGAEAEARAGLLYADLSKHAVELRRALEADVELAKNVALSELNERLRTLEKPIDDPVNPPSATLRATDFLIELAKSFAKGVATEGGKDAYHGISHLLSEYLDHIRQTAHAAAQWLDFIGSLGS